MFNYKAQSHTQGNGHFYQSRTMETANISSSSAEFQTRIISIQLV
jgi:hypothetical protein